MCYKCIICILLLGDYCKLILWEFYVKFMWWIMRESFLCKSLCNGWLKLYIKNYIENIWGINVDFFVILNLKKKDLLEFFYLKCVKYSW